MGRAAWGRRPPLTRERRNQPCRLATQVARWSAGRQGIEGEVGPTDGGTDGLGARPASIPAVGVELDPPRREKGCYGPLSASGFRRRPRKWGFGLNPARSGQKPDIDLAAVALPSAPTLSDVHPLHHFHQGRRAGGAGGRA